MDVEPCCNSVLIKVLFGYSICWYLPVSSPQVQVFRDDGVCTTLLQNYIQGFVLNWARFDDELQCNISQIASLWELTRVSTLPITATKGATLLPLQRFNLLALWYFWWMLEMLGLILETYCGRARSFCSVIIGTSQWTAAMWAHFLQEYLIANYCTDLIISSNFKVLWFCSCSRSIDTNESR